MVAHLYQYEFPHRKGLILQYNDGWGEIAPLPHFSQETFEEAKAEILSLLPSLSSAKPTLASVQFGLSSAKTPFSLQPLKVPFCAFQNPEEGCETLKIKVGHLKLDEAILLANQYKETHLLRIDCNQKWSLDQALHFASHFSPTDFDYLEEPLSNFSDLIVFSRLTGFPVAVDESSNQELLSQIPTLKAVIAKPTILGSVPTFPVPTILSSTYESSLGHLLIARLASSHTAPLGLGTFRLFSDDILQPPLRASQGFLYWEPSGSPVNINKLCLIASAP